MSLIQRIGNLDGISQHFFQGQRSAFEAIGQRLTFQVFHDQEVSMVLLADVVKRADMGVIEASNGARFSHKALMYFRMISQTTSQEFDGHKTVQTTVPG